MVSGVTNDIQEVGVTCIKVGVTCLSPDVEDVGHARNFVRIDDDKYNIHGLYAMDITWDSDKEIAMIEEEGKKTIVSRPDEEMQEKKTRSLQNVESIY